MLKNIGELFGIFSVIINSIFLYLNYRNKKNNDKTKNDIEVMAKKITNKINKEKDDKRDIEIYSNLLNIFSDMEVLINSLRKNDDELMREGTSLARIVEKIQDNVTKVQNDKYIFEKNKHDINLPEFEHKLDKVFESNDAFRTSVIKDLKTINSNNISFLKKIKSEIQ